MQGDCKRRRPFGRGRGKKLNGTMPLLFLLFRCGAELTKASRFSWPDCLEKDTVVRNAGRALFLNMGAFGATEGCYNDDCSMTDKFAAKSYESCINVCYTIPECSWWSFGQEDGQSKCWIRVADDGREHQEGFITGAKVCMHEDARELDMGNGACWIDGFDYDTCCDPKFGPEGNRSCWDGHFSYQACCVPPSPILV
ncbi:unnamed protein product [Amoebophrya sp. A25]|nr:unnamed protein product [Amoebophrya sp. A25]|eukprot:GSA25T00013359001.1